jgi:hypothetical protein
MATPHLTEVLATPGVQSTQQLAQLVFVFKAIDRVDLAKKYYFTSR